VHDTPQYEYQAIQVRTPPINSRILSGYSKESDLFGYVLSKFRWFTISEALFLSSITRLFFMSLTLIWPEGLPTYSFDINIISHSLTFAKSNIVTMEPENLLLAGLEFVNRSVALSGMSRLEGR